MNAFDRATAVQAAVLKRLAGRRGVYSRGGLSVVVTVIPGRTGVDLSNEEGAITSMTSDDFDITAAELVLGGSAVEPRKGDRLTVNSIQYEAVELPGERCWRYTDPTNTQMRIHFRTL